jgi:hypothetical protein
MAESLAARGMGPRRVPDYRAVARSPLDRDGAMTKRSAPKPSDTAPENTVAIRSAEIARVKNIVESFAKDHDALARDGAIPEIRIAAKAKAEVLRDLLGRI